LPERTAIHHWCQKNKVQHLKEKIATVRRQMKKLKGIEEQLEEAPDHQVSLTDPDARSMATSGRGTGIVGYNVQTAVDTENHLIVAHDVVNQGHDRYQLSPMSKQAKKATGTEKLEVLADRGYFDGDEILKCEQAGMVPLVPRPLTSNAKAEGRFDKRDFVYNAKRDEYRCPAGERAIYRYTSVQDGLTQHRYWPSACPRCPIRSACTPSDYRRISRWEHEDVLDRMQARLDRMPEAGIPRRRTVEHVFGTFKAWMGAAHFLTKTIPKVRTEISLHVLAYNLKRTIQLLGVRQLIAVLQA
jgi:transposase